ncbi:hypothetical protein INQ51_10230 [Maribellus sp. CM-23]|uniref:hypothetical protein n=1 Tax=Maribellus sp. CM-23 TaxID=2781026 RepID=UPI001F1E8745|nr:hypothetical protein [Maribellus sp. CM-23]MCE4564687.1 hypothetical protein [Maribellus sp. CM-23]
MKNINRRLYYLFLLVSIFGCSEESDDIPQQELPTEDNGCAERIIDEIVPNASSYDWEFKLIETFDDADVTTPETGLNDNLENRRLHGALKSSLWTRKEGEEVEKHPSQWYSQVNHPAKPNAISFHVENAAVMLLDPIESGSDDGYKVSFVTNPIKEDRESDSWTSFMLDAVTGKKGYVKATQFGFSIASNGEVKVYQNGNQKTVTGTVSDADEYEVMLIITPGQLVGHINGQEISAVLDEDLPKTAYLFLGAEIEKESGNVSWIDEVIVSTRFSQSESHLLYYGYYWASGYYGEHLTEVSAYTNFNFIEKIRNDLPNEKKHVLQARWEFWGGSDGALNSNWQALWAEKLVHIKANIDKIRAIYLVDEPFWAANINVDDYNMVLDQIRADLPNMPIITVFAYPTIEDTEDTRISDINCNIDWVGADKYVALNKFDQIENMNNLLMQAQPEKDIFLVPQTFFQGTETDAEVAEMNWKFYNYALQNNKIKGIWNFGLWTHQQPDQLPLSLKVQKIIGNAIVNN